MRELSQRTPLGQRYRSPLGVFTLEPLALAGVRQSMVLAFIPNGANQIYSQAYNRGSQTYWPEDYERHRYSDIPNMSAWVRDTAILPAAMEEFGELLYGIGVCHLKTWVNHFYDDRYPDGGWTLFPLTAASGTTYDTPISIHDLGAWSASFPANMNYVASDRDTQNDSPAHAPAAPGMGTTIQDMYDSLVSQYEAVPPRVLFCFYDDVPYGDNGSLVPATRESLEPSLSAFQSYLDGEGILWAEHQLTQPFGSSPSMRWVIKMPSLAYKLGGVSRADWPGDIGYDLAWSQYRRNDTILTQEEWAAFWVEE